MAAVTTCVCPVGCTGFQVETTQLGTFTFEATCPCLCHLGLSTRLPDPEPMTQHPETEEYP